MTSSEGSSNMDSETIKRKVDEIVDQWEANQELPVELSEGGRLTIAHFIDSIAKDPSPHWEQVNLIEFQARYLIELPELLSTFEQVRFPHQILHQPKKVVTTWEIAHAMSEKLDDWCFIQKKPIQGQRQGYA